MCCSECGYYDAFCEHCCPCVSFDACETILCCAACLAVLAGTVLLAAYGFIRHAEVTVGDASLMCLALTVSPATAFSYNLSLTLTVRNKNRAMSVRNTTTS